MAVVSLRVEGGEVIAHMFRILARLTSATKLLGSLKHGHAIPVMSEPVEGHQELELYQRLLLAVGSDKDRVVGDQSQDSPKLVLSHAELATEVWVWKGENAQAIDLIGLCASIRPMTLALDVPRAFHFQKTMSKLKESIILEWIGTNRSLQLQSHK